MLSSDPNVTQNNVAIQNFGVNVKRTFQGWHGSNAKVCKMGTSLGFKEVVVNFMLQGGKLFF